MAEFAQENRRALVMLAVALVLAVIAAFVLLLGRGGGGESESALVPRPTPTTEPVAEEPEPSETGAVAVFEQAAPRTDPFAPLAGTEEDRRGAARSDIDNGAYKGSASARGSFVKPDTSGGEAGDAARQPERVKSPSTAPKPKSDEPKPRTRADDVPVVPQPIADPPGPGDPGEVTLVSVSPDEAVVRTMGERQTLALGVPGTTGITYLSWLGGKCAWMAGADATSRVTLCEGETTKL